MTQKILIWLKNETVLAVAAVLALVSMVFIQPDLQYPGYMDLKVLVLLFCLMIVVAGFRKIGFFAFLGRWLAGKAADTRSLTMVLVFLCFFTSMLITNDVALLTFVPFAISLLQMTGQEKRLIPVIVLQTIAANLGSMLTPIGNPQNLYLYSLTGMGMGEFFCIMAPLTVTSFLMLLLVLMFVPREHICMKENAAQEIFVFGKTGIFYTVLFLFSMATVAKVLPYQILFVIVLAAVVLFDRAALREPDYALLATFVCFFVFIGNMQRIDVVCRLLDQIITGRELPTVIVASQVISNVPAAVLLSGFTNQAKALLYGTNIGGLGTLIASLASLISYKFYIRVPEASTGSYLLNFTKWNVVFLAVLTALAFIII